MDLFGIKNNTFGYQHNFVLPEGHWSADKFINSIANMIWYYINKYHSNKKILN